MSRLRIARVRWGERLSRFGARHGIGWLEYNPLVFMYFHEKAAADAPTVIGSLERLWSASSSYYDAGAGTAAYAAEARRRGHRVLASEHSRVGRLAARVQGVPVRPFDLSRSPPAETGGTTFDLAYCFEVAEHVPPALGDRLVAHLAAAAPVVVFTAAHPGQGGIGHVNEQPKGYWIERFKHHGMRHLDAQAEELAGVWRAAPVQSRWLVDNVMVFER
jgi:SAM-dependent methyltransferase